MIGNFLLSSVPKLKETFTAQKIIRSASNIFKTEVTFKNKELIKEGEISDKIYIIQEGTCSIYKNIAFKDA